MKSMASPDTAALLVRACSHRSVLCARRAAAFGVCARARSA
jgi:hypothetical protein